MLQNEVADDDAGDCTRRRRGARPRRHGTRPARRAPRPAPARASPARRRARARGRTARRARPSSAPARSRPRRTCRRAGRLRAARRATRARHDRGSVADVGVRIGRERVPRRPHLHFLSVSVSRVIIASCLEVELPPWPLLARADRAAGVRRDAVVSSTGVLTCALEGELVQAWQRPSGEIVVRAESDAAVERLRFVLALDDDHSEFLRRFADDPLLGEAIRQLRGFRALRLPTVAGALLRALCGQLIQSNHARELDRAVVRATSGRIGRFATPPTGETLAARSPADLRRIGLHARRAATLVRLCRSLGRPRTPARPSDRRSRSAALLP